MYIITREGELIRDGEVCASCLLSLCEFTDINKEDIDKLEKILYSADKGIPKKNFSQLPRRNN